MTRMELVDLIDDLIDQVEGALDNDDECEDGVEYARDELQELLHALQER
jgi:hypothetical protein